MRKIRPYRSPRIKMFISNIYTLVGPKKFSGIQILTMKLSWVVSML